MIQELYKKNPEIPETCYISKNRKLDQKSVAYNAILVFHGLKWNSSG